MIEIAQSAHGSFCKEDLSATLPMTAGRSAIKTPRRLIIFCAAPPLLTPHFYISFLRIYGITRYPLFIRSKR